MLCALAACGTDGSELAGVWSGTRSTVTWQRDIHTSGNKVTIVDPLTNGYALNIESCGDELAFETIENCAARAEPAGMKATVVPNWTCMKQASPTDPTYTLRSLGGEITLEGDALTASLQWEETAVPSAGDYEIITVTASLARYDGHIPRSLCGLGKAGTGIEITDYSALVGCTSFSPGTTVTFDGAGYTPRCLQISVGQTVTFSGDFAMWQLYQGLQGDAAAGAPGNPIGFANLGGTSKSFTFDRAGDYVYNCHTMTQNTGMIRVR